MRDCCAVWCHLVCGAGRSGTARCGRGSGRTMGQSDHLDSSLDVGAGTGTRRDSEPGPTGGVVAWNEDQSARQGSTRSMPVCSKSFVFRVASKRSLERQIEAICASKPSIGCPRRSRVSTICE